MDHEHTRTGQPDSPRSFRAAGARAFVGLGWLLLTLAFVAQLAVVTSNAIADSGQVISLPLNGARSRSGLMVRLDTRWVEANGYRRMMVEVLPVPAVPLPADRSLRVELRAESWNSKHNTPWVSDVIELPQGTLGERHVIWVPQKGPPSNFSIRVYENGRIDDLSADVNSAVGRFNYTWSEASPAVLVIDSRMYLRDQRNGGVAGADRISDIRGIVAAIPSPSYLRGGINHSRNPVSDGHVLNILSRLPKFEMLPLEELPKDWIGYSCFDLMVVSLADLAQLGKSDPDRLDAIRRWARTGRGLIVYRLGDDYARLRQLETLLQMTPELGARAKPFRGWQQADPKLFGDQVVRWLTTSSRTNRINNFRYRPSRQLSVGRFVAEPADQLDEISPRPDQNAFVVRDFGLGRVVAMAGDTPFPGSAQKWAWAINSIGEDRVKWYRRNAMSQSRDNVDYFKWQIPGVGTAPVYTFLVLISLFVIAIGPFNYIILHRIGRLYLILVTVPLGAGLVTASLLAYALFSEGLSTQVRVRSYTHLDQRNGWTASASRQTYYAALGPSGGLIFPRESAVYSLVRRPSQLNSPSNQRLIWRAESQQLAQGYIEPRTLKQFVVIHSGATEAKLEVAEGAGSAPKVTNQLGTRIRRLVLRNSDGRFFAGEWINRGATVELKRITARQISADFQTMLDKAVPAIPAGFPDVSAFEDQVFFTGIPRMRPMRTVIDAGEKMPLISQGMVDAELEALTSPLQSLAPRSYFAEVDVSPGVPLGVGWTRQRSSLQIVEGRW